MEKASFLTMALAISVLSSASLHAQVGRATRTSIDLDAATGSDGSLGVAQLGGVAFITSRGVGTTPPHLVTAVDIATGATLGQATQSALANTGAWGYRDGTSDGVNLMFGYDDGIEVVSTSSVLSGTAITNEGTIVADNGPQPIVNPIAGPGLAIVGNYRGVAYDPSGNGGNGSFWTGSFGSSLIEIDLAGNVLTEHLNGGWSIYGLALDHDTGMLWCNSAPASGDIAEIDPVTGTLTGRAFNRAVPGSAQGGLAIGGPLDGRGCGSDLIGVDQSVPDQLTGYRLNLWDNYPSSSERALLTGVDGGALTEGPATVNVFGTSSSVEIDLGGDPGALWSAFINFPPASATQRPVGALVPPNFIKSAWEFRRDLGFVWVIAGSSGAPISIPTSALPIGKIAVQGVSVDFDVIDPGCDLYVALSVSNERCFDIFPPACGVVAEARGTNSFNSVTTSGFFSVTNQTGQDITALQIDATPITGTLRFDTDQTGIADRFDAGISTAASCANSYRNGSDTATGLVYAGTRLSPACSGTEIGWNGTVGAASIANDFQILDFTFADFNDGEKFEFDCDTDGGVGINGSAMAGMTFRATLADGTVCTGILGVDPGGDPNLGTVVF